MVHLIIVIDVHDQFKKQLRMKGRSCIFKISSIFNVGISKKRYSYVEVFCAFDQNDVQMNVGIWHGYLLIEK